MHSAILAGGAITALAAIAGLTSPATALPVGLSPLNDRSLFVERQFVEASLRSCLANTGANIVYFGNNQYANLSAPENTVFTKMPDVIVQPNSTQQVAEVVKCVAADSGRTKISPRGGGHGYAAYSLDGNIVLDSTYMTDSTIDATSMTVTSGFGETLGPLASKMADEGFALPHGTCPQVGIAGHGLGGGWGFTSRRWGWLLDHIVAMEVVDAQGNIRQLTSDSTGDDGDLWWALRGAGSNNFGVVTHFTFAMEPAPNNTINFSKTYGSNDDCAQVLLALQTLGSREDGDDPVLVPELGGGLLMYGENTGGNPGACQFRGQYLGTIEEYRAAMKNLNDELAKVNVAATNNQVDEFPSWKDALTALMGNLYRGKSYEAYYAQSIVDDGEPGYTLDSARAITDAVQAAVGAGGASNSISFDLNGPASATNIEPAPNGNQSFIVRRALFFSQIYAYGYANSSQPEQQQETYDAITGITDAVRAAKPDGEWHAYVNYIDPNITDFGQAYYGDSLDRLKSIKATADPDTIFDFPQGLAHA